MVVIHIANVDTSIIGGVQLAVPKMVRAQSRFATVGLINTHGDRIDGVENLELNDTFEIEKLPPPFDKPDLVVFHEVYRVEFTRMYKRVKKSKIPFIIIPHGCLSKQAQKRKLLKKFVANQLLFKRFIAAASSLQYLSQRERDSSAFPKYPYFICGNGIEMPREKKESFFTDGVKIVYVGRLEIITKGLDLLLEAISEMADTLRAENVRFEIYGPEYEGELTTLRKMADELSVSDIVTFGGARMGEEKEKVLLSADCFIQASRTEGLPMGPLEALAYGLPCIVTEGVGLGEIIESHGAGYGCETSAVGIRGAIESFLKNADGIELMSRRAIELAEKNYDAASVAEKTLQLYRELLKTTNG